MQSRMGPVSQLAGHYRRGKLKGSPYVQLHI
jgi:hypothetical protein